jgi:hypothetical protein
VTSFPGPTGSRLGAAPSTALVARPRRRARAARLTRRRWRLRRTLLLGGGLVAAALLLAQALLPTIAEHEVRSALGSQATGVHVDIRATPAVKLLWHRADHVNVEVDRLTPAASGGGSVGDMISGLRVAPDLNLRVHELDGPRGVRLRDVSMHKHGDVVVGRADVNLRSLESSLPFGMRVRPVNGAGDGIRLEGSIAPLGRPIAARATLLADGGRIVVRPEGIPIASALLAVPVFSDDRIAVDSLAGRPTEDGLAITARAHLR